MSDKLPSSASVAHADADAGPKLFAPAAARNVADITALLQTHAPKSGRAMEVASGTGQHVVSFAGAMPRLHWQPTDIDPARRASIDAHAAEAGLPNVARAITLDATAADWGERHAGQDLIVLINLLHLISAPAALCAINEMAVALSPGGKLVCYGPFKRNGQLTSAGDARFDAELRTADPEIGYKDSLDMRGWLGNAGLTIIAEVDMPANNLAFIAGKPA
ncbi:MAG: DUF938 domain-containing protein [Sulfitobacter sp.]|nr:DUF938 domain-containing protein [Sulfitobacter sp.]